jgi:ankyrin repeat protein
MDHSTLCNVWWNKAMPMSMPLTTMGTRHCKWHGDVNMAAAGNKDGITALHVATEDGNLEIVHMLLSKMDGNGVNAVEGGDGFSALHIASQGSQVAIVQALLQHGQINVNAVTKNGLTALHMAAAQANIEIVQLLVEHGGCNVTAAEKLGLTALHIACQQDHLELMQYLAERFNVSTQ